MSAVDTFLKVEIEVWSHGDPSVGISGDRAYIDCELPVPVDNDMTTVREFLKEAENLFSMFWDFKAHAQIVIVHEPEIDFNRAPPECRVFDGHEPKGCHCLQCGESGVPLSKAETFCNACLHAARNPDKPCAFGCDTCRDRMEALAEKRDEERNSR